MVAQPQFLPASPFQSHHHPSHHHQAAAAAAAAAYGGGGVDPTLFRFDSLPIPGGLAAFCKLYFCLQNRSNQPFIILFLSLFRLEATQIILSDRHSVCLYVSLSHYRSHSIFISISLLFIYFHLFNFLYIYLSFYNLSTDLSINLTIYLSIYQSIILSSGTSAAQRRPAEATADHIQPRPDTFPGDRVPEERVHLPTQVHKVADGITQWWGWG